MSTPHDVERHDDVAAFERLLARLRAQPSGTRYEDLSNYDLARLMYRERRAREAVFGDGLTLFGEPAWDMLLDLYIARTEKRGISVSSACLAAIVPMATALRWIDSLTRRGLVEQSGDESDRRRSLLWLSDKGFETMELFFQFGPRY